MAVAEAGSGRARVATIRAIQHPAPYFRAAGIQASGTAEVRTVAAHPMTLNIPATSERIEMRLPHDDQSGMLYLQALPSGLGIYSLREVLDLGWQILETTPAEQALLRANGFDVAP